MKLKFFCLLLFPLLLAACGNSTKKKTEDKVEPKYQENCRITSYNVCYTKLLRIYLLGSQLFMIMDTVADFDHDAAMKELAGKPRQSEWEAYVSRFQRTSAEATADEKWQVMERIYKLGM